MQNLEIPRRGRCAGPQQDAHRNACPQRGAKGGASIGSVARANGRIRRATWSLILFAAGACISEEVPVAVERCADRSDVALPEWTSWSWTENPHHPDFEQGMAPMALAQIDDDGIPDVVLTTFAQGQDRTRGALVALSGADGRTLWSVRQWEDGSEPSGTSGIAVAQVQGEPLLGVATREGLVGVDRYGRLRFRASVPVAPDGVARPTTASLTENDHDLFLLGGSVVTMEGVVLRHGDPATVTAQASLWNIEGLTEPTLLIGGVGHGLLHGGVQFEAGPEHGSSDLAWFQPKEPSLVHVVGGTLRVASLDGLTQWERPLSGGSGGSPLVVDVQGDGALEIVVASRTAVSQWSAAGELLWSHPVADASSGVAGIAALDLEGDGLRELVYADEESVWVLSGEDGGVLGWDREHASGTLFEVPLIASLDDDVEPEFIIVASNYRGQGGRRGVTRYDAPARCGWSETTDPVDLL